MAAADPRGSAAGIPYEGADCTPEEAVEAVKAVRGTAAIAALEADGYLVFKVQPCKYGDRPHGRHSLITRSAMCPGSDPLPHGFKNIHMGSWGYLVFCQCGGTFADYTHSDDPDEMTKWTEHKREHGIEDKP